MNLFWVYSFFFLSGATGLIYEVLWFRLLKLEFGSLTITAAFLFAVFLSGLALGSGLTNRWLNFDARYTSMRRYLFGYGVAEIAIGALALLSLLLIPWAGRTHFIYNHGISSPLTYSVDLILFALILLPPTLLMGFTYPLIAEFCELNGNDQGDIPKGGNKSALLYCANVLGGGCGALLAGFWLIPRLGMTQAMLATALINVMLGSAALWLHGQGIGRRYQERTNQSAADVNIDEDDTTAKEIFLPPSMRATSSVRPAYVQPTPFRRFGLTLLAFLSGWLFLALEIVGNRSLQLVFGSTTYTFSVILFCVLIGIAIGSFTLSRMVQRLHETRLLTISAAFLPIAVAWVETSSRVNAYLFLYLYPWITKSFALSFWRDQLVKLGLGMLSYLPPFILSGFLFASLLRLIAPRTDADKTKLGSNWSRLAAHIYKINTIGSVVACLVLPLFMIGKLSTRHISLLLIIISIGFLPIVFWTIRWRYPRREMLLLFLLASLALMMHAIPVGNAHLLQSGIFLRAAQFRDQWFAGTLNKELSKRQWRYFSEGRDATILVEQDGPHLAFYVNGRPEATTQVVDKSNQYLLSLIPYLLHGPFESSAVVALGAGMTAGVAAELSGHTDIIEINDKVPAAAAQFRDSNFNIVEKFATPKARLIIEDGRHFLQGTNSKYDLLTSDPLHPFTVGATNLYSLEYFQLCRDHLKPGGYFTHWLPLYQVGTPQFAEIVKSFTTVFANGTVWLTHKDSILVARKDDDGVASQQSMRVGWDEFAARFKTTEPMFAAIGIEAPEQALALYMRRPLNWFLPDTPVVTDNSQSLEFSLPHFLYVDTVWSNVFNILSARSLNPLGSDLIANPPKTIDTHYESALYAVVRFSLATPMEGTLSEIQKLAAAARPYPALYKRFLDSLFRHANLTFYGGNATRARQLIAPYTDTLEANLLQIEWLEREQQTAKAFDLAKQAIRQFPNSHWLHYVVGRDALQNNRYDEAIEHFVTALRFDPLREIQPEAQNQLTLTYYQMHDFKNAADYARQSLQIDPSQLHMISLLKSMQ